MEKGIDKSAQRALEAYPVEMYEEVGWRCVDKNSDKRKYFIEGYHQAEKDIGDPIAWIKEVSGVKELSRAKEEALKAYPPQSIAANYDTIDRRDAFEFGYLKAEKDLELTYDDICEIMEIREDVLEMDSYENLYEEILKRFKERKDGSKG